MREREGEYERLRGDGRRQEERGEMVEECLGGEEERRRRGEAKRNRGGEGGNRG